MALVDGWYPRINPTGEYIAGGAVTCSVATLTFTGSGYTIGPAQVLGEGVRPKWIEATRLLFYNRLAGANARLKTATAPGFGVSDEATQAANLYDAGNSFWAAELATTITLSAGSSFAGRYPAVDQGGRYGWLNIPQSAIYLNTLGKVYQNSAGVFDPSLATQGFAWSYGAGPRRTGGWRTGTTVEGLSVVAGDEFYPIVVDTPEGPWLLITTQTSLLLHPWGNPNVVLVHTGITDYPHAVYRATDLGFVVAWSAGGVAQVVWVDVDITDPLYAIGAGTSIGSVGEGGEGGGGAGGDTNVVPDLVLAERARLANVRAPRPVYPIEQVEEGPAKTALRILFDRVFQIEQNLQGPTEGSLQSQVTSLAAAQTTTQADLDRRLQQLSVATAGEPITFTPLPGGGGAGGGGGGGGGGQNANCAGAGATGHIPAGELTFERARLIICGTGNEFAGLRNPTATLQERLDNALQLLLRVIWHLQQGGFIAGRQRNPSTNLSPDALTVEILGEMRAFDIMLAFDAYDRTIQMQMLERPADYVADAGIAD